MQLLNLPYHGESPLSCRIPHDLSCNTEAFMGFHSYLAVGSGAVLGAWLRWWLALILNEQLPSLPMGTLAANLIGGLLIGLVMGSMSYFESLSPPLRLLITTGFLGGLTTFSTFSAETVTLLLRQQYAWACAIIALHLFGSLFMTLAGIGLIRLLLRA